MSHIDAQYSNNDISFYQPHNVSFMNTPQYMLTDSSYPISSLSMYDSSMQLDDNTNNSVSQTPNVFNSSSIYQQPSSAETPKYRENGTSNWNGIHIPAYNQMPDQNSNSSHLVTWTPVLQQPMARSQITNDESVKKVVYVSNTIPENTMSNYTLVYGSRPNSTVLNSYQPEYWNQTDSNESDANNNLANNMKMNSQPSVQNQYLPSVMYSVNQNQYCNESSPNNFDVNSFPKRWLVQNFERVEEDCTIARSTMYGYYVYACHERGEKPMNSAGLGKVIGSVFGRMKNRRLGARGDSRYHYLGIKVKENSQILSIPPYQLTQCCALYSKAIKNNSKTKPIDKENESSNDTQESSDSNFDLSIQKRELKNLESLDKHPLTSFTSKLSSISNIKVFSEIFKDSIYKDSDKSYPLYSSAYQQLENIFSNLAKRILECFKDLNNQKLYNTIKEFWMSDTISLDIDKNSTSRVISLKKCIDDDAISKYVYLHDEKFYQIIINECLGEIHDDIPDVYIDQVLGHLYLIENALRDSLIDYDKNFINKKLGLLRQTIKIVDCYKEIQVLRRSKLKSLLNRSTTAIKIYQICSDPNWEMTLNEFHQKNNLILKHFHINIKEFDTFFLQLATAPICQTSKDWLILINNKVILLQNNYPVNELLFIFMQEWCLYESLMVEFLHESNHIDTHESIFLNSLVLRIIQYFIEYQRIYENSHLQVILNGA